MKRPALTAAWLALTALTMPGRVGAAGFDQFIAFGDSTLDSGYFRYHSSGNAQFDAQMAIAVQFGATGGWAGNGVMNTTILAEKFGLTDAPFTVTAGVNALFGNEGSAGIIPQVSLGYRF
jgi:outer membrane lipase/esterase